MKEIRAIIRPNKLPKLRTVLREMPGFPGMTVQTVHFSRLLTKRT
mgnify:CR=1 FL=1